MLSDIWSVVLSDMLSVICSVVLLGILSGILADTHTHLHIIIYLLYIFTTYIIIYIYLTFYLTHLLPCYLAYTVCWHSIWHICVALLNSFHLLSPLLTVMWNLFNARDGVVRGRSTQCDDEAMRVNVMLKWWKALLVQNPRKVELLQNGKRAVW